MAKNDFQRWLALYFIEKGCWKITDKAVSAFGDADSLKQFTEFAENSSDREREERTTYLSDLDLKEKKKIAKDRIREMIKEGKAEELLDNGYIIYFSDWRDKENRIAVIRQLVNSLGKDPRNLIKKDFCNNRLAGLFFVYYHSSPYAAIKEAFPELDLKVWEIKKTSIGFYENKENRIAIVKWLVEKLGKDPRDLTLKDFYDNRLAGLITNYYDHSPYAAVIEAFPELDIKPWEMKKTSRSFFKNKENRIVVIKWFLKKLGKDPKDLKVKDFCNNKLGGLLNYYNNSPYAAVKEAFPELDIKLWEMKTTPRGFYKNKENRVAAVKWLVEKLGKDPRDLTAKDFYNNRLAGLLADYYKNSPYAALKEAGLVSENDVPTAKETLQAAKRLESEHRKQSDKNSTTKQQKQRHKT